MSTQRAISVISCRHFGRTMKEKSDRGSRPQIHLQKCRQVGNKKPRLVGNQPLKPRADPSRPEIRRLPPRAARKSVAPHHPEPPGNPPPVAVHITAHHKIPIVFTSARDIINLVEVGLTVQHRLYRRDGSAIKERHKPRQSDSGAPIIPARWQRHKGAP